MIFKVEFDKNIHAEYDCCKACGYEFDSYETMYCLKNTWDGDHYQLCCTCLEDKSLSLQLKS